ncbi:MAG: hypothetical protein JO317_05310, partial [Verrucomicrobiae bacterium]|nr:hypothetical protein [Verrucomicrobiae bacterium]
IESLKAGAFQGTLSGKGQVNLRDKQPFEFAIEGSALDLKAIFARKPDIASSLSGKVDLQAKVRGEVTHPADLTGDGSAQVKNATVSAGLLRWVVLATRMPEMETVQLTQCDTKFTIGERKMTFNPINAISQDLRLTGTGWQSFDNLIDFNFRIALSSRIHTHIPNEIAGAFQKQPDDFFGMDFRVWGSLDQPKEDFAQRIGEDALKSAAKQYIPGGILNEVFDKLSGGTNQPNASPPGTDASSSTNAPPATNAAPSNPNPLDQIKKLF